MSKKKYLRFILSLYLHFCKFISRVQCEDRGNGSHLEQGVLLRSSDYTCKRYCDDILVYLKYNVDCQADFQHFTRGVCTCSWDASLYAQITEPVLMSSIALDDSSDTQRDIYWNRWQHLMYSNVPCIWSFPANICHYNSWANPVVPRRVNPLNSCSQSGIMTRDVRSTASWLIVSSHRWGLHMWPLSSSTGAKIIVGV